MDHYGRVLTAEEFQLLQEQFSFLPEHGVMIPVEGSSIYDCPLGKVGHRQWFWVNQNLVAHGFLKTRDFPDHLPKLFGDNLTLGKRLGNIIVIKENWEDFILAATGAEVEISLEMGLRGHYRGKLCQWEVDLVEALPPPVSEKRIQELARLLSTEGRNANSGGPASPSHPVVGAIFPAHFPSSSSAYIPMTESDDVGLRPRKMRNTVSVPKLLGVDPGSYFVLGGAPGMSGDSSPSDKPSMVDEVRTASSPLASEAYALGWVVTKDSLLSEYIAALEWNSRAHPPATMKLFAAQSGTRMAVDL
ncbi:unnamed protein product [Lactuca saligna]|uniref:Uncharacterized protein n=1 Tax=Lactuca saligna TaxID=75948 RepID=A0AA35ZFL8_LACSI|nr:unnamed protein product [Lactuca saligna]